MFRKAAFWCVAVICGMLLDHFAFPIIPGSYFSLGMSAVLVISANDADCRYEAALPGDFSPGQDVRHWRPGIMVRVPEKTAHPTDQWRASEYYGETELEGMRIRFVVEFEPTFLGIARFYGTALALCLAFLYSAYAVVSLMTRALSRRTDTLRASARGLPERIEAGEYPSWPSLDIQEMADISEEMRTVSIRLRSLFDELRLSRDNLECAVRDRTEELERKTEEVRLLLARVELEREEERTRVARELHDEFGQDIAGLGMALYLVERHIVDPDGRAAAKIKDMRDLLGGLSENMRRLVSDLRPSILDRLGLPEALARLAEDSSERSGLRVDFSNALPETVSLSGEARTAAYRIAQEALNNALRHSGGRNVRISLGQDAGGLVLEIADDGSGFEVHADGEGLPRSFGIIGMRERCRALGGEFHISSTRGAGTVVRARLRMDERSEDAHSDS